MRKVVLDIETKNIFEDIGKADPALLDISMVCIYDYATNEYSSYLEKELPQLWPVLEKTDMLIGYNSDHFDIPLLNKYYHGDFTRIKSIDLLKEIKHVLGRRIRLNAVAEGTLGVKKSGKGLDAIKWWNSGEIGKLREYCLNDVKITKDIYDFVRAHGFIRFKDVSEMKEVKLDASEWEAEKNVSMTRSLPF